jgi:hypothetical protein
MLINGRLLLLIVAIGLFVRVWKTNEHPRTRPIARPRSHAAERIDTTATEPARQAKPVSSRQERGERRTGEESWTMATSPIPLPAGITAGTYRVINDTGRVAKLTVAADEFSLPNESPSFAATDVVAVTIGSERWYFIRLRPESTAAVPQAVLRLAAELSATIDHPQAHRKFDFSGYETVRDLSAETIVHDGAKQATRPAPPEMPSPL